MPILLVTSSVQHYSLKTFKLIIYEHVLPVVYLSVTVDIMVWEVVTPAVLPSDLKCHKVQESKNTGKPKVHLLN